MKSVFAFILLTTFAFAEEEGARDKLVKEAQRVEKAVIKDLGSLREKACQAVKGTECVPEKPSEEKKPATN
jgi:hypothetical protein